LFLIISFAFVATDRGKRLSSFQWAGAAT